jgi:hypothetical protein
MPTAVNCLVTDPRRNLVSSVLGTSCSKLAIPYARANTIFPSRASKATPLNPSRRSNFAMYAAAIVLTLSADCCEKATEGLAKQKITIKRRALRMIFLRNRTPPKGS